jgi:hypothetical protein
LAVVWAQTGEIEPWDFENVEAKRAAERRLSTYWYENYSRALGILDSGSPGTDDLQRVVTSLKLAIAGKGTSSAREIHPRDRVNIAYFPYFHLARAYVQLGRAELAERCIDKESSIGAIAGTAVAADFTRLQARVAATASVAVLMTQAQRAEDWGQGQGGVALSAAGRAKVEQIRTLAGQLETDARSPDAVDRLTATSNSLIDEMLALVEGELSPLRSRLDQLGRPPWREAFGADVATLDPSGCAMPGGQREAARVGQAGTVLEQCSSRVPEAMRTAGAWACAELTRERQTLQSISAERQALLGAPAPVPELPGGCNLAWNSAGPGELAGALDGIDLENLRTRIRSDVQTVTAELGKKRDELRSAIETALARVPSVPRACVADLQLSQASRKIDALPRDAAAVQDPASLDGSIDAALADLLAGLDTGVGRLVAERDQCSGLDTSNLDALDGALAAYRQGPGPAQLQTLCSTAARANADVGRCWESNTALVRENVEDYRWLLESALTTRASVPTPDDVDLSCLTDVRGKLRPDPPRNNAGSWVQTQRSNLNEAQACLLLHDESWKATFGETRDRVESVHLRLQSVGSAAAQGGPLENLGGVASRAAELHARVSGLSGLYDSETTDDTSTLRQRLEELGMLESVPADWWVRADALRGKDARMAEAWRAVRDVAASNVVVEAVGKLGPLEQLAGSVSPFLALQQAFATFGDGDVDGAILTLRAARAQGQLPASGRSAALGHTALSYFLFTKATAASLASDESEVSELLRNDARREAREATTAEEGFIPPETLFASTSFRNFFGQQ